MTLHITHHPSIGQITLSGKLSRGFAWQFLKFYREALPSYEKRSLVIHMGEVNCFDTSGLGTLLLLHQDAKAQGTTIHLKSCNRVVRELLSIPGFNQLFAFID